MFSRGFAILLLAVLLVSGFLFFWKLGSATLENWDEGIHAEVSQEMYRKGAWLSMSYRDELYTAKPPLKFWMTTALFPVFGVTEFSVRFWSACAGVATALLLALWSWQWTHRYTATLVAVATFLFSQLIFLHAFRTGETDGLLVFSTTAALYCYWQSQKNQRWFYWFGAWVGIAIMLKSIVGLLPVLIAALDLTVSRRWTVVGFRTLLKTAGIALIVVAPWHLYETIRHGMVFWRSYIGFHVLDRTFESLYANDVSWWWYADILFRKTFPYKFLVPLALLASIVRFVRVRDALDRLLLLAIVVLFLVFSAAQTKFAWYILPLFPFLAMLAGRTVQTFIESHKRWLDLAFILGFFGTIFILPTGLEATRTLWKLLPHAYLPSWFSATTGGRLLVAGVATMLLLVLFVWVRRVLMQPRLVVGGAVLVYIFSIAFGWQLAHIRSYPVQAPLQVLAKEARDLPAGPLDVYGVDLLRQPAGYFYLRRDTALTLREVDSASAVTASLVLTTSERAAEFGDRTGLTMFSAPPYLILSLTK